MAGQEKITRLLFDASPKTLVHYEYFQGKIVDARGQKTFPHTRDFYEIVWFEKANDATVFVDFLPYKIKDNHLFIFGKEQPYYFDNSETHITCHYIAFREDCFTLMGVDQALKLVFTNLKAVPNIIPKGDSKQKLRTIYELFREEYRDKSLEFRSKMLCTLIMQIIVYFRRANPLSADMQKEKTTYLNTYHKFIELLQDKIKEEHSVTYYANQLAISEKHLNRICQEVGEGSCLQLIHKRLNLEAKRQLFLTNKSVKEVAYSIGFKDSNYFGKFFKNQNGSSPMDFKKLMSEIYLS